MISSGPHCGTGPIALFWGRCAAEKPSTFCRRLTPAIPARFHPSAQVDTTIYDSFIANNESRIEAARRTLWPKPETGSYWSGLNMSRRIKLLDPPFEEIYEVHYPHLSWQVHSGLTGVVNSRADTFTVMCGQAFKLAADSYREILLTMIEEFSLEKANPKIKAKLKVATLLPLTDTPEQADSLRELSNPD